MVVDMDVDLAVHDRWDHVSVYSRSFAGRRSSQTASEDHSDSCSCSHRSVNSEEGLSAREGLLLWCQRKTSVSPYQEDGVEVRDFGKSFSSGLAL